MKKWNLTLIEEKDIDGNVIRVVEGSSQIRPVMVGDGVVEELIPWDDEWAKGKEAEGLKKMWMRWARALGKRHRIPHFAQSRHAPTEEAAHVAPLRVY